MGLCEVEWVDGDLLPAKKVIKVWFRPRWFCIVEAQTYPNTRRTSAVALHGMIHVFEVSLKTASGIWLYIASTKNFGILPSVAPVSNTATAFPSGAPCVLEFNVTFIPLIDTESSKTDHLVPSPSVTNLSNFGVSVIFSYPGTSSEMVKTPLDTPSRSLDRPRRMEM